MTRNAEQSRLTLETLSIAVMALFGACHDATGPHRTCAGPQLLFTETGGISAVEIETANGDGGGRAVLVQTQPGAGAAAWSPDGCHIAYTADVKLFVANADGSNAHVIYSGQTPLDYPAWRPDGRELLFTAGYRVWRINSNGSAARPLTTDSIPTWSGSWSSDGALIAYVRAPSAGYTWPWRLVVINDDGSGMHVVTDSVNQGPAWVPGTHRISYGHYLSDTTSELREINADGSDDNLIAGGLPNPFDLAWTPAGDTLYFVAPGQPSPDFQSTWNIYSVRADGSGFGEVIAGEPMTLRPNVRR